MSLSPLERGAGGSFWLEVMECWVLCGEKMSCPKRGGDARRGREAQDGSLGVFFFLFFSLPPI